MHARDEEMKSLVSGTLLKESKFWWRELGTAEKNLIGSDKGEPEHTFKFRNAMVSLGPEEGSYGGQQRAHARG